MWFIQLLEALAIAALGWLLGAGLIGGIIGSVVGCLSWTWLGVVVGLVVAFLIARWFLQEDAGVLAYFHVGLGTIAGGVGSLGASAGQVVFQHQQSVGGAIGALVAAAIAGAIIGAVVNGVPNLIILGIESLWERLKRWRVRKPARAAAAYWAGVARANADEEVTVRQLAVFHEELAYRIAQDAHL